MTKTKKECKTKLVDKHADLQSPVGLLKPTIAGIICRTGRVPKMTANRRTSGQLWRVDGFIKARNSQREGRERGITGDA